MHGRSLLILVLAAATTALADTPRRSAPVLPEVTQHLSLARAALERGDLGAAEMNARAVLLRSELRYRFEFIHVSPCRQPGLQGAVISAMDEWRRALDQPITFHAVGSTEETDLVFRFETDVRANGESVAGFVNWSRRVGPVSSTYSAVVRLRNYDPLHRLMPLAAVRHSAMHEMGHILGLDDSTTVGDVMGGLDLDHPVSRPRPNESETVRIYRAEATAILADAAIHSAAGTSRSSAIKMSDASQGLVR